MLEFRVYRECHATHQLLNKLHRGAILDFWGVCDVSSFTSNNKENVTLEILAKIYVISRHEKLTRVNIEYFKFNLHSIRGSECKMSSNTYNEFDPATCYHVSYNSFTHRNRQSIR